jgi:putative phosphoribosyl transferase
MANPQDRRDPTLAVEIPADVCLRADLQIPAHPSGVVLFAHGSGSSRLSPRNQYVARQLQLSGLATVLLDLLTSSEEVLDQRSAHLRFDIDLLAKRLLYAVQWIRRHPTLGSLRLGCFGASTGAAAALLAASEGRPFAAIVSRGGRPDLAGAALEKVQAPVLLIVGANDPAVLELNRQAKARLNTRTRLAIVPGATHLFEEPGALEQVAHLAQLWFERCLLARNASSRVA